MKTSSFSIRQICLLAICALAVTTCAQSNLKLAKDETLPDIVRSHKSFYLGAKRVGLVDTGIYIGQDELYTILATGSIDMWPGGPPRIFKPEDGWPIMARIGRAGYVFSPILKYHNSGMHNSYSQGGELYLGYKSGNVNSKGVPQNPEYYKDDTGGFKIDVIVWKEENYTQIYNFLDEMRRRDLQNAALADAAKYTESFKNIEANRAQVVKKVEETKQMIEEIKEQKTQTQTGSQTNDSLPIVMPSPLPTGQQEEVVKLEAKLTELMAQVAQFDEMRKQFAEERKKTEQLTQALEETSEREKDLLTKLSAGAKAAPVIVVASPLDGTKTEASAIQLTGVAEDESGISQINITANTKTIFPKDGRSISVKAPELPKRYSFNERIPLDKGVNIITIRSVDTDGLAAETVLKITRIELRRNVWALVVGINEYQHVRKLKYAVNDASAFYNLLINQNQIPQENVTLLTDQQASLRNLRRALGTQLKKSAAKDDMVIIFFAGHGATEKDSSSPDGDGLEKYLLPVDAEIEDIYTSAIPMREISHIFRRLKSERIIFIADACYSGASGGRTVNVSGIRASISDAFLDRMVSGKGTIIMTASGANEVSMESEEYKHGIFSYFLIEGLKGKADSDADGLVTVDELYPYVYDNVARTSGQEQHPVRKGVVEGRFVFGIVR